jgi:hypothetical protein
MSQIPGFATKFSSHPAGYEGWSHLYSFSWFFVCIVSSIVYFGVSRIGTYAEDERSMPFEALALEREEILDGVAQSDRNSQDRADVHEFGMDTKV